AIMTAQDKTFAAADGSELKILKVTKLNTHYDITVEVSRIPPALAGGLGMRGAKKVWKGKGFAAGDASKPAHLWATFTLLDAEGEPLTLVREEQPVASVNGRGELGLTYALKFQTTTQQAPLQLIYTGSRTTTFDVPFTLQDVPLIGDPQALLHWNKYIQGAP